MEKLILIYVSALNLLKCIILVEVSGKKICLYAQKYTSNSCSSIPEK